MKEIKLDERCNRAFRYDRDAENRVISDDIFNQYVLGGIEVLYQKIMQDTKDVDDYIIKSYMLMKELNENYISIISEDEFKELFKIAGN